MQKASHEAAAKRAADGSILKNQWFFLWLPLKDLDRKGSIWYDIDFTSNGACCQKMKAKSEKVANFWSRIQMGNHESSVKDMCIWARPSHKYTLSCSNFDIVCANDLVPFSINKHSHTRWPSNLKTVCDSYIWDYCKSCERPLMSQLFLLNSKRWIRKLEQSSFPENTEFFHFLK